MMVLVLNDKEATVFAYRVVLRQLAESDIWLDWEDYPYLTEQAFNNMARHVQVTIPGYLADAMRLMETTWDIDGADLMEQALNPPEEEE
jgi:hypothetical protein